ncbi:MAG: YicC/YloC family endoribonuclease [Paracoccaceae bacterium]
MAKSEQTIRTVSMTGFASQTAGHDWAWDIRSVNGKTLDLRLRLPGDGGAEQGCARPCPNRPRGAISRIEL